jgi:hypothetical protein
MVLRGQLRGKRTKRPGLNQKRPRAFLVLLLHSSCRLIDKSSDLLFNDEEVLGDADQRK